MIPRGIRASRALRAAMCSVTTLVLMASVGCAPRNLSPGVLPEGKWSGTGTFFYESWSGADEPDAGAPATRDDEPRSLHRDYVTKLAIRPSELGGRPVILVEIVSQRGAIPQLGDKTDLRVALQPEKTVADGLTLYRIRGLLFNPGPGDHIEWLDDAPAYSASCMADGDDTVFQIQYATGVVDVFRFHGDALEKTGTLFDDKQGLVQWAERLRRLPG